MSQSNATGLIAKGSPTLPLWFTIVRYVTLLFSIGVLAAASYNLSLFSGFDSDLVTKYSGPTGFLIFDSIWTLIIIVSMLVFENFFQAIYYRIVFLVSLSLAVVFWIAGWAWAASRASDYFSFIKDYSYYYDEDVHGKDKYGDSLAAEAGLGAVCWVLTIVILAYYIVYSLRSPAGNTTVTQAELGAVRHGEPKRQQQVFSQSQYPASPPVQQQEHFGYPQQYPTAQQYPQQQHPQQQHPQQQYPQQQYPQQQYPQQQYPQQQYPQQQDPQQQYPQQQ